MTSDTQKAGKRTAIRHWLYAKFRHDLPSYYSLYGEDYTAIDGLGNPAHRKFDHCDMGRFTFGGLADLIEQYIEEEAGKG